MALNEHRTRIYLAASLAALFPVVLLLIFYAAGVMGSQFYLLAAGVSALVFAGCFWLLRKEMTAVYQRLEAQQKAVDKSKVLIAHNHQRAVVARQAVDRAKEQRDKDIANISHELRTPLTGLVNSSEMLDAVASQSVISLLKLSNQIKTSEELQLVQSSRQMMRQSFTILDSILKPSIQSMESVVTQLLDSLEDIEMSGEIKLISHPFNLSKELETVIAPYRDKANSKNLAFACEGLGATTYLKGDSFRVGQVVSCLLDNAIRFTSSGGVTIKTQVAEADSAGRCQVRVTVSDTGCGVSAEQKNRIFDLFHIGEKISTKENAGLGTGLAIARKVAEKLGGSIRLLESELGNGSVFEFCFNLPQTQQMSAVGNILKGKVPDLCLLYVEDAKVNRTIFKRNCESANVNLQMAEDGLEGWDKYRSYHFDALVVDLFMPRCDGFELVQKIRAYEKANNLKPVLIFALTATPTEANRQKCLSAGFDEFLAKPYRKPVFDFIIDRSRSVAYVNKQGKRSAEPAAEPAD